MAFRVILFEDNDLIRYSLEKALLREGYEVISASDPTHSTIFQNSLTSCCRDETCGNFLLTDNNMSILSGLDFIERQTKKGCKGIMRNKAVMSAYWEHVDLIRAKRLGCKIFHKPFDVKEIIDWLEEGKVRLSSTQNKLLENF